jgi:hypothetical protein
MQITHQNFEPAASMLVRSHAHAAPVWRHVQSREWICQQAGGVCMQNGERAPLRAAPLHANGVHDSDAGSADEEDPFVEIVEGMEGYAPHSRPSAVSCTYLHSVDLQHGHGCLS